MTQAWIKQATSNNDALPALTAPFALGDDLIGCDGYRAHIWHGKAGDTPQMENEKVRDPLTAMLTATVFTAYVIGRDDLIQTLIAIRRNAYRTVTCRVKLHVKDDQFVVEGGDVVTAFGSAKFPTLKSDSRYLLQLVKGLTSGPITLGVIKDSGSNVLRVRKGNKTGILMPLAF